jgi:hypothetical protein
LNIAAYRSKEEVIPWMQMNDSISMQFQGGIWRVNFEIDTLPSEEAVVMTKLQQLKNSEDFADKLKEAPQIAGRAVAPKDSKGPKDPQGVKAPRPP